MHRRTASCLIFLLLAGALLCHGERLKVQVVQTHTGIKLGGAGSVVDPNGAGPSLTRCNGDSGTRTGDPASTCNRPPVHAAPAPSEDRGDYSLFFDVIVIMPDATRVVFHCSTILDAGCEGFPVYPQSTSVVCSDFQADGSSYKDCTASGASPAGIGVYEASVHGDRMTIFGPNWERHYRRKGTWDYPAASAQDPKPAAPRVIKVATVQNPIQNPILDPKPPTPPETAPPVSAEASAAAQLDPKPASPPEITSSVPQDAKPAAPQDPKPAPPQPTAPPATQDPKPPDAQDTKPALPSDSAASPQDTAPATQQETKPALPPETAIPAPQETKPIAPPAGDAAPIDPQHAAAAVAPPASAADQQLDPTVIEQAKAGDMVSQYKLGYDYYRGRGVALDYVQAAIWWRKAADQGYPSAQNNLGVLYNAGKGVPQSYAEAYFWENLAAARAAGILQAQFAKNRDESASRLWFYERSKVQRRAAKWAVAHPVPPRSQEPKSGEKVNP